MRELNLNPWYAVAYRRLNQWVRRQYFKVNKRARQKLYKEKMSISHTKPTEAQRKRLQEINWTLGTGISVYRFTPAQEQRQLELTEQIIAELKAEGKW
jgi:hypothetical protein